MEYMYTMAKSTAQWGAQIFLKDHVENMKTQLAYQLGFVC